MSAAGPNAPRPGAGDAPGPPEAAAAAAGGRNEADQAGGGQAGGGQPRPREAMALRVSDAGEPEAAVRIVEVGPRDGLQNEASILATADKLRFIDLLAAAGLKEIEVSSFVRPDRVPQLADADALFTQLKRHRGVRYSALVANARGLERALAARVDGIALFTAASETFARTNIGMTIDQSITAFRPLASRAKAEKLWVRAYLSTAFHCPFEGPVAPDTAVTVVSRLLELGVDEVSVGDTIGAASPDEVRALSEALAPVLPLEQFAYHFHDTGGAALANVDAALEFGIRAFDASAGGLGGCPFAPGAPGNLATEALVGALAARGLATGVDPALVRQAANAVQALLKRSV